MACQRQARPKDCEEHDRPGQVVDLVVPGQFGRSSGWSSGWVAAHGIHTEYAGDDSSQPKDRHEQSRDDSVQGLVDAHGEGEHSQP